MTSHSITTIAELEAIYGAANPRSITKEIDHVSDHYRAFIDKAPFLILATVGPEGLDCSPRGDPPGFVRVQDRKTLLIPDRRGNNRIDSLRNIVRDPRVSLLFLIPGIGETLRVNGTARIRRDSAILETFIMQGKPPRTVIEVRAERVYFQCPKALHRSHLWEPSSRIERSSLPSSGEILEALDPALDGRAIDANYPAHLKETIY